MRTKTSNLDPRKSWRHRIGKNGLLLLILFALFLVWPHRTRSQTSTASSATQALPQRVVYGQVFRHVVFLDNQADLADQQGQNGGALRNYYQTKAALTAAETTLLKSTAHSAVASIQTIQQQVQAAVTT